MLAGGIVEGRKTFANITKYIFNVISGNFGNMSTVALSSLFLAYIPLLPSQILLNNFLCDLPMVTVATDRVDDELLRRPRRWNIGGIARFMVAFGLLSAVFDLLLIGVMMRWATPIPLFRSAWFVESAWSELLVIFSLRTRHPLWRSRPSAWLVWTAAATGAVALALPYTGVGRRWFEFVPVSGRLVGLVGVVLALYVVSAELAKRAFFRRMDA